MIAPKNEVYTAIDETAAPVVATADGEELVGTTFENVPAEQSELIARRLPLVHALLTRHGRAYDYRVHTVAELESILKKLDAR